jgi:hypothetical protein
VVAIRAADHSLSNGVLPFANAREELEANMTPPGKSWRSGQRRLHQSVRETLRIPGCDRTRSRPHGQEV